MTVVAILIASALLAFDVPLSEPAYSPVCENRFAAIAASQDTMLAVWSNSHTGFSGLPFGSVQGVALEKNGTPVFVDPFYPEMVPALPAVASDGANFLVAMNDLGRIDIRIVDWSGFPLTGLVNVVTPVRYESPTRLNFIATHVETSWNGSHYVVFGTVVESDGGDVPVNTPHAKVAIIDGDGNILHRSSIDGAVIEAVAPAGPGRMLLVWSVDGRVWRAFVDDNGVMSAPVALPADMTAGTVAVASDGNGFLIVWIAAGIAGLQLDATGATEGTPFAIAPSIPFRDPAVIWDGTSYVVVASTDFGLKAVRVMPGGRAGTPFVVADQGSQPAVAVTSDGDTVVLFTIACGSIASTMIPKGVERTASEESHFVSIRVNSQSTPTLIRTASGYQTFWLESPANGGRSVRTVFIRANGVRGTVRTVSDPASFPTYAALKLGDGSALFWTEQEPDPYRNVIYFIRFDSRGEAIEPRRRIAEGPFIFTMKAVSDGSQILLTMLQSRETSIVLDVWSVFVKPDGAAQDKRLLSDGVAAADDHADAAGANGFLTVWRELHNDGLELVATTVAHDGSHGERRSVLRTTFDPAPRNLTLGSGPSGFLLAWTVYAGNGSTEIRARKLDESGAPSGPVLTVTSTLGLLDGLKVVSAPDGDHLTWTDATSLLASTIADLPSPARTLATLPFPLYGSDYLLQDDSPIALVASVSNQRRLFLHSFAPPARRRAVRH
ncbi:MAG TPA: hypothetical protein VGK31_15515 [Thermoanaerobaculia bacterium]